MTSKYQKLLNAYSVKNLTELTSQLINLYKTGNKNVLIQIVQILSDFVRIEDGNVSKIFSQLMMFYHPDKSAMIQEKIKNLINQDRISSLKSYMHILELDDLDDLIEKYSLDDDIELEEDEIFASENEDYEDFDENEDFEFEEPDLFDFYSAAKKKIYGNKDVDFPPHLLEDYEEMEMSKTGITDLAGVEDCKYIKKLYLNNNEISNISELQNLENIEELYLSKNKIGFIDSLESLENLCILDISFNNIDDISPLLDLEKLEYVNLLGNNISQNQIDLLREMDVIVVV